MPGARAKMERLCAVSASLVEPAIIHQAVITAAEVTSINPPSVATAVGAASELHSSTKCHGEAAPTPAEALPTRTVALTKSYPDGAPDETDEEKATRLSN